MAYSKKFDIIMFASLLPTIIIDAVLTWGMLRYGWFPAFLIAILFPFLVYFIILLEDYIRAN